MKRVFVWWPYAFIAQQERCLVSYNLLRPCPLPFDHPVVNILPLFPKEFQMKCSWPENAGGFLIEKTFNGLHTAQGKLIFLKAIFCVEPLRNKILGHAKHYLLESILNMLKPKEVQSVVGLKMSLHLWLREITRI